MTSTESALKVAKYQWIEYYTKPICCDQALTRVPHVLMSVMHVTANIRKHCCLCPYVACRTETTTMFPYHAVLWEK
jgi:hypothetical protein